VLVRLSALSIVIVRLLDLVVVAVVVVLVVVNIVPKLIACILRILVLLACVLVAVVVVLVVYRNGLWRIVKSLLTWMRLLSGAIRIVGFVRWHPLVTLVSSILLVLIEPILLRYFRSILRTVFVLLYTRMIFWFVLTLRCLTLLSFISLVSLQLLLEVSFLASEWQTCSRPTCL
jgi:hypothetical protein